MARLALAALFAALLAAPAQARTRYGLPYGERRAERLDQPWELQLRPGFAVPRGPLADIGKNSFTLHGSVERRLNRVFSLGLEVGQNLGHKYEGLDGVTGRFTSNIHIKVFQVSPILRFGWDIPVGYRSLRPYGIAGVGAYFEHRDPGTLTFLPSGRQVGVAAAPLRGHLGLSGGVGLAYRPTVRLRFGAEVRIHYYSQDGDIDGDGHNRDSVRYLTPAAVLAWLF